VLSVGKKGRGGIESPTHGKGKEGRYVSGQRDKKKSVFPRILEYAKGSETLRILLGRSSRRYESFKRSEPPCNELGVLITAACQSGKLASGNCPLTKM